MNRQNHLVSVIVPIYNSEKYLEAALDSVKAQSYKTIEVLMIDDGSTDSSSAICERYAMEDSRFRMIHQMNQGPSAARNHGIREARGEYIVFLDSDDMLHEDFVRILMNLHEKYDCDIALTKSYPFLQEESIPREETKGNLRVMDHRQLSVELVETGWKGLAVVMAKIYKKSLFENIFFDESRVRGEDDTILYQLYWEAKKSVLIDAPLYFYRSKREGSLTHSNFDLSWLTGVAAFKERMEFYYEKNEKLLYARAMRTYCRRIAENYYKIKMYLPDEREQLRNLKKEMRKYSHKLFVLPGNGLKQKCSALLFAWIPDIWGKIYYKVT